MRLLILGATGMLGHKLMQVLGLHFEVTGTIRGLTSTCQDHPVLASMKLIGDVRAETIDSVVRAIAVVQPDAVINGIGLIKQLPGAKDPLPSLTLNALFPHRLAQLCQVAG